MNISFGQNILNFKPRRKKFGVGSLLFLLLFGAVFTGLGLSAVESNKIDPSWTKVSGEIVDSTSRSDDNSTTYAPVIQYEVNGQSYRVTSSLSSSSKPRIGEKQDVAFDPSQPGQAKVVETFSTMWLLYIFPVVGIICIGIAVYAFIRSIKRSANIKRLIQSGQKLQGVVVDVKTGGGNNNGGGNYLIVVAATDASGTVQNYQSDTLTGIGGLAMADFHNSPIPIDVYVDPVNPKNYYVDVTDIPSLTPERIEALIKSATTNNQASSAVIEEKPSTPPINPTLPPSIT